MSRRSLELRLVLLQLGVAVAVILLFSASALWLSARVLGAGEQARLRAVATQVARSIELEEVEEKSDLPRAAVTALQEGTPVGVGIEVRDRAGRMLHTTRGPWRHASEETRRSSAAISGGGLVIATSPVSPGRRAVVALAIGLVLSALPLLLITAAFSRGLARRSLQPLRAMASQAESASLSGQPEALGDPADPVELRHFAASFNRLLERLRSQVEVERHFVQDAAHELRTPLSVIMGEIEHARADPALPPRARGALDRVQAQSRGLSELVEALLLLRSADPVRLPRHELPPVNLADVVRDVAGGLAETEPARAADLALDVPDELLVAGREMLLVAAVRNLTANAVKFTCAGERIRIAVCEQDGWGVVEVDDAGPGVPEDEQDRIFDAFYRGPEARASSAGFGLGLPLLRRVAQAHGGEVTVGRSPLGGARFALRLPRWRPQAPD